MHELVTTHRDELIERCKEKVARRTSPRPTSVELDYGVPLFLDQLIETLRLDAASDAQASLQVSGHGGGQVPDLSDIGTAAAKHGGDLQLRGFTVEQVVHDYGDVCQAITELAIEKYPHVAATEFHTLNRCLDNAIAAAVTEYSRQHDLGVEERGTRNAGERLGHFAHELRNLLASVILALNAIKTGKAAFAGPTAAVLDRNLLGLRNLIDRTLAEVRLSADMSLSQEVILLFAFISEIGVGAALEAQTRGCKFTVDRVDQDLTVKADRHMLASAVSNLLQNAFKYTRPQSNVSLKVYAERDRIFIEIADECGGLPPGQVEELFAPFSQRSTDRSGLGLGLTISRRAVKSIGGNLYVRNLPGTGCIFTIDLPLHASASSGNH